MKKKALIILPSYSVGGAEKVLLSYFKYFKSTKIKIKLLVINSKGSTSKFLNKNSIRCAVHYIPVYMHQYFKKIGMRKNDYTENNLYFKRAISLPIYPGLSKDKLRYIIKKIKLFLNK